MRTIKLLLLAISLSVTVTACKPDLIAGTQLEDTEENREVLTFLTRYQLAMQSRKVDDVMKLVAADYFENNGNDKPEDDYGVDGLRSKLTEHFARTKEIVLEVYVQKIERDDKQRVSVAYRFNTRARIDFPSGQKWLTATEVNKIILRKIDDDLGYRILSGL